MTIDEVINKATIEFSKPLSLDETEELMKYITIHLPGDITYTLSYEVALYHEQGHHIDKSPRNVSINGHIRSNKDGAAFDFFNSQPLKVITDTTKVHLIRFSIIPGYDKLTDYNPITTRLWGDVRKVVTEYFEYEYRPKSTGGGGAQDDSG